LTKKKFKNKKMSTPKAKREGKRDKKNFNEKKGAKVRGKFLCFLNVFI